MTLATVKEVLEVLYFLSGPVVAAAALIGLRQLSIAKRTAASSAKRDAYKLASHQISFYLRDLIPLIGQLQDFAREEGLDIFKNPKLTINNDSIQVSLK